MIKLLIGVIDKSSASNQQIPAFAGMTFYGDGRASINYVDRSSAIIIYAVIPASAGIPINEELLSITLVIKKQQ